MLYWLLRKNGTVVSLISFGSNIESAAVVHRLSKAPKLEVTKHGENFYSRRVLKNGQAHAVVSRLNRRAHGGNLAHHGLHVLYQQARVIIY